MSLLFLNPGDRFFGSRQGRAETILGSCVSVLVWLPSHGLLGLSHCLLPTRQQHASSPSDAGFYLDETLQWFVWQMRLHRTSPEQYQAWIFGGGDMFARQAEHPAIGEANVRAAKLGVQHWQMSLQGADVGGTVYRKLSVDLASAAWTLDSNACQMPVVQRRPRRVMPKS